MSYITFKSKLIEQKVKQYLKKETRRPSCKRGEEGVGQRTISRPPQNIPIEQKRIRKTNPII